MPMIRQFFSPYPLDTEQISIHAIGIQEPMRPGIVNRLSGTGDYLFMLFYDSVTLGTEVDIQEYPGNTLMIWGPGQGQYYGNSATSWLHSWLHCAGSEIATMLAACALPLGVPLTQSGPEACERYLLAIYHEVTTYAHPDSHIVGNTLHSWLREARRAHTGIDAALRVPPRLLDVQHYLHTRFDQPITLNDLAARANLSVPHFCSEFKRAFGMPAIEYLIHVRLRQAVYLLQDHHLSIAEISERVGYQEMAHFSKLFKERYRMSPSSMRKQLR